MHEFKTDYIFWINSTIFSNNWCICQFSLWSRDINVKRNEIDFIRNIFSWLKYWNWFLQIANNVSLYFDQLSNFFMRLKKQCFKIQRFGFLYFSINLQKALYDYYVAIIRLCKHITQFLRKSNIYLLFFLQHFCSFLTQFETWRVFNIQTIVKSIIDFLQDWIRIVWKENCTIISENSR